MHRMTVLASFFCLSAVAIQPEELDEEPQNHPTISQTFRQAVLITSRIIPARGPEIAAAAVEYFSRGRRGGYRSFISLKASRTRSVTCRKMSLPKQFEKNDFRLESSGTSQSTPFRSLGNMFFGKHF
tara:strand:- start:23360 stop:23740 length:381 start_codon:yes stop_codon:yes gene_type:complete